MFPGPDAGPERTRTFVIIKETVSKIIFETKMMEDQTLTSLITG